MLHFDLDAIRASHALADVATRYGVDLIRSGLEWKACCPFHDDKNPSFTIYHAGGGVDRFQCFACGAQGDVLDFVGRIEHETLPQVCERLGGEKIPEAWTIGRPPADAPLFVPGVRTCEIAIPKRNTTTTYIPTLVHPYLDASGSLVGYVLRIDKGDGGKLCPTILWMNGQWAHGSMPEPRPLYNLADLIANPGRQVLVVEGEKCADVGNKVMITVTWCGGSKAHAKTDWTPMAGRRCVLWPDADEEGHKAMETIAGRLAAAGCRIRWIEPEADRKKGWDIADAVTEGLDVVAYAQAHVRDWVQPERSEASVPTRTTRAPAPPPVGPATIGPLALAIDQDLPPATGQHVAVGNVVALHGGSIPLGDDLDAYQSHFIIDEHGKIKSKLATNFFWMLRGHPDTRRMFSYNEQAQRVFVMKRPPWAPSEGPWVPRTKQESDNYGASMWLEQQGLAPKRADARDAIDGIAGHTRYNPVRDYLNHLVWDGNPRLQTLAVEYLGAPADPIYSTFVTRWHIAAVARIMRPGIKVDTMLILESPQGKFKSTYLRTMATICGHEYFTDSIGDIMNKDSIITMKGTWIVEVAELSAFTRQEVANIKAWLSRTTDHYRPPYEKEPMDVPRSFIVAGTHNPSGHGYLKDTTGNRRQWPTPIQWVDLLRVERDRDQIWAEAVFMFKAGVQWWLTAEEEIQADLVTRHRRIEEAWGPKIEHAVRGMPTITIDAIITELQIPIAQQTELTVKRIAEHLSSIGYVQHQDRTWRKTNGHAP